MLAKESNHSCRRAHATDSGTRRRHEPDATRDNSICVWLAMVFGSRTIESRTLARQVHAMRLHLGLPQITHAVAGNPTPEENLRPIPIRTGKLREEAHAELMLFIDSKPELPSPTSASSKQKHGDDLDSEYGPLVESGVTNAVPPVC